MVWSIVKGPGPAPWEGKDVVGWVWALRDEDGNQRRVLVEVSGTAMAVVPEVLPADTANARATRGRSEVEAVLKEAEPPKRITLGTIHFRRQEQR